VTTLHLDENTANYQIRAYRPGMIQINEEKLTRSLIVSANTLIKDWTPQTIQALSAKDLQIIIELKPTILLLGTGTTHVLVPINIYGELINHGIGVEVMDTSAACRTFNALTAENRNVAAALIIE